MKPSKNGKQRIQSFQLGSSDRSCDLSWNDFLSGLRVRMGWCELDGADLPLDIWGECSVYCDPDHDTLCGILAKRYGYIEIVAKDPTLRSFIRGGEKEWTRINVWNHSHWRRRTVGTCLNHPRQKFTQLFRRKVTDQELDSIFRNPRVHTGKGYKKICQIPPLAQKKKKP